MRLDTAASVGRMDRRAAPFACERKPQLPNRANPGLEPRRLQLAPRRGGDGEHWRAPGVDRFDDLGVVDALQIDRGTGYDCKRSLSPHSIAATQAICASWRLPLEPRSESAGRYHRTPPPLLSRMDRRTPADPRRVGGHVLSGEDGSRGSRALARRVAKGDNRVSDAQ
jgi:hypothetical protein